MNLTQPSDSSISWSWYCQEVPVSAGERQELLPQSVWLYLHPSPSAASALVTSAEMDKSPVQSCFLSHAKICTMWKLQEVQVWMHACVNQREQGWGDDWWNRWQLLQPASDSPQHKAPNGRAMAEGESLVSFLSQPASLVTSMSASRFRHARFSRLC